MGPQAAAEPGVQHIAFLLNGRAAAGGTGYGVINAGVVFAAVGAVPHRDAMPPPQLPADAPVADVLQPVEIDADEPFGDDFNIAVDHSGVGPPGDAVGLRVPAHIEEPLQADEGFHHFLAALALAHGMVVILHPFQGAGGVQLGGDGAAGGEPFHAGVLRAGRGGHTPVKADDVDDGQAVPRPDFKVHHIVAGGDFERPGAEVHFNGGVGHHRNLPVGDGQDDAGADFAGVARVVGMDGHAGVAQHRLRAGGGHGDILPAAVGQRIADVIQLAVLFGVVHFQVGQGGGAAGTPVDDALVAVNQPFAEQVDEGGADGAHGAGVEGKAQPRPVAGSAQAAVLFVNDIAVAGHPFPHPFLKPFPSQVVAIGSFLGQGAFHHPLGGDAGVVLAGQPEGGVAPHPVPAGEGIL